MQLPWYGLSHISPPHPHTNSPSIQSANSSGRTDADAANSSISTECGWNGGLWRPVKNGSLFSSYSQHTIQPTKSTGDASIWRRRRNIKVVGVHVWKPNQRKSRIGLKFVKP